MPNKNETAISSIYDFESPDEGRIKDPNVAHEIANLEKPARERELQLEKEANEGMTETERFHLAVIEKFHETYPLVPQTLVDGEVSFVVPVGKVPNASGVFFVLTKEGLFYSFSQSLSRIPEKSLNKEKLVAGVKYRAQQYGDSWVAKAGKIGGAEDDHPTSRLIKDPYFNVYKIKLTPMWVGDLNDAFSRREIFLEKERSLEESTKKNNKDLLDLIKRPE